MFTQEEASYRLYKQASFLVADPTSPAGKLVPGKTAFNVKRTRAALANQQVQADGFEREFANGNHIAKATGGLVINLNFLGHILSALCNGLTSTAFSGVYQINVTNGGSGYTSAPAVGFTGGTGGSGTTAVAVILGGQVIAVVITDPGTGWTGAPNVTFTGGGGASAAATAVLDATKFKHVGKLISGAPLYYALEKGVSTYWRRYLNMVLQKVTFNDVTEGICEIDTDWTGSGHVVKAGATLDAGTVEVTGTPGEYANLSILHGATLAFGGIIKDMNVEVEARTQEKRIPTFAGKASELRRGASMVKVSGTAYFEDETFANLMENGTLIQIMDVLTSPDGILNKLIPEAKVEVEDWERRDDGIYIPFVSHGLKKVSASAPITFTLINGTSSY